MLLLPEQMNKLIDDVTEVISYSQEVDAEHLNYVSQIIEDWQEAKSELSDIRIAMKLQHTFLVFATLEALCAVTGLSSE